MKLLIKKIMAITDVAIIIVTLTIPDKSDLSMAPVSGLVSPSNITKVSTTAICAMMRLLLFNPGVIAIRMRPAKTGIRAVTDGVSEAKYAQLPRTTSTIALNKFTKYGFIPDVF